MHPEWNWTVTHTTHNKKKEVKARLYRHTTYICRYLCMSCECVCICMCQFVGGWGLPWNACIRNDPSIPWWNYYPMVLIFYFLCVISVYAYIYIYNPISAGKRSEWECESYPVYDLICWLPNLPYPYSSVSLFLSSDSLCLPYKTWASSIPLPHSLKSRFPTLILVPRFKISPCLL